MSEDEPTTTCRHTILRTMHRDLLTRSSALRAVALGAVVAPLWVAWSATSCLLADPPPALLTIPTQVPMILPGSVPPAGAIFTNWPAGGLQLKVYVQLLDPTATYQFLVMEDYGTPNSAPLSPPSKFNGFFTQTNPDGSAIEEVPVPPIPLAVDDPNCHTFSLFVAPAAAGSGSGHISSLQAQQQQKDGPYFVSSFLGSAVISWTYAPAGGLAECAAYDAAGLTDTTPVDVADAPVLDGLQVLVDGGRADGGP